ncbi:MAG TPA: helix-turn-helix domain-containing protein [Clostridia bacterium]|nr:helix-turn-helix domain-containing protein [Clostridia bacterium]
MTEKYFTVEQISKLLGIHPKTIQRYIREGKLRAKKIGKSWRVNGHDLSVFAENEESLLLKGEGGPQSPVKEKVKASAVVDIAVREREEAQRIVSQIMGALNSKPADYGNSSVNAQYIEQESIVRVSLWGGIRFLEVMAGFVAAFAEQEEE